MRAGRLFRSLRSCEELHEPGETALVACLLCLIALFLLAHWRGARVFRPFPAISVPLATVGELCTPASVYDTAACTSLVRQTRRTHIIML